jgi:hypothetical protein
MLRPERCSASKDQATPGGQPLDHRPVAHCDLVASIGSRKQTNTVVSYS